QEVYRLFDAAGMAVADLITLDDEEVDESKPLTIFDPQDTWKKMTLTQFTARKLLRPLVRGGQAAGELPGLKDIRAHREKEEQSIWEQHLRLVYPTAFKVDWSDRLWQLRNDMLHENDGREDT
ncbi:MAG TPA: nicotinate phosphoribosyltransferase, partial [Clostridia bacterium]|nr:nicotinate phosphoribosyltransferase [Clostridia bacterium]